MIDTLSQIFRSSGKKKADPKRVKAIQVGAKKADEVYAKEMEIKQNEEIPKAEKELERVLKKL